MLPPLAERAWTRQHASHLLNRAGFGGAPSEIDALKNLGCAGAVTKLVSGAEDSGAFPPPEWAKPQDMLARRREAMERAGGNEDARRMEFQKFQREQRSRMADLQNGWLQRMLTSGAPFVEKMTLFWHGHFATSAEKVKQAYYMWLQNETLRRGALGSFGRLLKSISRDPAMVEWLDLRQSRSRSPNENFARELMELFSLGEGHYTEEDIKQAARAFTGYRIDPRTQSFQFQSRDADPGEKTVFGRTGNFAGDDVIDLILKQPQCARFMAKKIWEFFVYEEPGANVIEPLAQGWRESGYDVRKLMDAIFRSAEFYSPRAMGMQIKSPVQWIIQASRQLELGGAPTVVAFQAMRQLGQVLFRPPNVKGWDGGKAWITTASLFARYNLAGQILGTAGAGSMTDRERRALRFAQENGLKPVDATVNIGALVPGRLLEDPSALVDALCLRLYAMEIPIAEKTPFIEFAATRFPLDERAVAALMHLMMSTPRYQLC